MSFNLFLPTAPFFYLLKTFSDVFRWYRKDALGTNGLIQTDLNKLKSKTNKIIHKATVKLTHTKKHPGLQLDTKLSSLSFNSNKKISKATKGREFLPKLKLVLPCSSLLIIYKSFKRPHLDNGNVVYHQPSNASLSNKIELIQNNTALAIT